ncbi:hypothetical protein GCM10023153_22340 [Ornithinibacter aureus]|uniref:Uncharacterized protein n=1 Tax=Ornithinibacter aureus TaxID=622664 RepID=A0ABP8JYI6_9MICO
MENDLLEAIVQLPGGLAENTEIPLSLLILRSDKPARLRGKAHVVDLRPYMTTQARGARRRVNPEGLTTLWSALQTGRPGPSNRLVDVGAFGRRMVRVSRPGRDDIAWPAEVAEADSDRDVRRRYGSIPVEWIAEGDSTISFDVAPHFPEPRDASRRDIPSTTRLSALLAAPPALQSMTDGAVADGEDSLYVPTGAGAAATTPPTVSGRVLHFRVAPESIHPEYLAGWLNSDDGRSSLASALDRAGSGSIIRAVRSDPRSLWRLADELVVPVRPLPAQRDFANALLALRRVENLVQEARADLWTGEQQADLVAGPFDSLLDQSLERWTASLPYPFATALWTLTSRNGVDARHRQIFHTWESYAAFMATVLLSALRQDGDLADVEAPVLRRALVGAGLSLERPTFGTWNAVIQRLASRFRSMLEGEAEERIRVCNLFGGPRAGVLAAVLNPNCVQLLAEVNSRRNLWLGHSGATSEAALQTQIDYLTNALEELRALVGEAWTRMPLVRAGRASRRRGELTQEVEVVMGTNVPFRPGSIRVGEIMEEGELYIATDGCTRPLPLSHLIVLRSSPSSERHACYFFNRAEGDSVRLVSYQMTISGEIYEPRAEYDADLAWLLTP